MITCSSIARLQLRFGNWFHSKQPFALLLVPPLSQLLKDPGSGYVSHLRVSPEISFFLDHLGTVDDAQPNNLRITPTSPLNVVTKAIASAQEWTHAQVAEKQHTNPTRDLGLAPPRSIPTGTMICNTVASWNLTTTSAGLGWIFNTQDSPPQQGCQSQTLVQSAIQAEGLAIRSALSHAIHLGFTKIWLRSDSLGINNAINSITKPKNLHGVLSDIENLSSCFHFCFFSFVPREQNGPADCVAKASLCNMTSSWV